jgi:hypothetical protein
MREVSVTVKDAERAIARQFVDRCFTAVAELADNVGAEA